MAENDASGSSIRNEVGARLREVEKRYPNRAAAAAAAGVSKSTFQRWLDAQSDISLDALARLASGAGFALEWLAFGIGPKFRAAEDDDVAEATSGGWINGDLLEDILSKIRRFMLAKGKPLTLRRYERMGFDLYNQVARFSTAPERNAALQVLIEQAVPAAHTDQSAHEHVEARRLWEPPAEPSK